MVIIPRKATAPWSVLIWAKTTVLTLAWSEGMRSMGKCRRAALFVGSIAQESLRSGDSPFRADECP